MVNVFFFSKGGVDSPVVEYLIKLQTKNVQLFYKAIAQIEKLPDLHTSFTNIKAFSLSKKLKCFELKVRHKNDACRFFYIVEHNCFILLHGFTKKTQKTSSKDIDTGIQNLKHYHQNSLKINF